MRGDVSLRQSLFTRLEKVNKQMGWIIFFLALNSILIIVGFLMLFGLINLVSKKIEEQDQNNDMFIKHFWNVEERVTRINERVNNIKMRYKC